MGSAVRRVGIIGLGKMGRPMARHLRKAGFEVAACDIDAAACREAEQAGTTIVADPRAAAQLLVMAGGDAQAFEACRPALASFASTIFHLGELSAGQVGKMVNNMILWSCISANFEGFKLAQAMGVDLERLRTALLESSASNWAMQTRIDTFPMPWAEKDMRIVLSEADHLRLSVPLCGVVTEVVKTVKIERGWPTPEQRET